MVVEDHDDEVLHYFRFLYDTSKQECVTPKSGAVGELNSRENDAYKAAVACCPLLKNANKKSKDERDTVILSCINRQRNDRLAVAGIVTGLIVGAICLAAGVFLGMWLKERKVKKAAAAQNGGMPQQNPPPPSVHQSQYARPSVHPSAAAVPI